MSQRDAFVPGNLKLVHWVAGVLVLVVLVLTSVAALQKVRLSRAIVQTEAAVAEADQRLIAIQEKHLDSIIAAQQQITEVRGSSVRWSQVLVKLLSLTPVDVFYRAYSAAVDGRMNVSVLTDSYASAADLIAILTKEEAFSDVFVSSITQGASESGNDVVSFGLTFNVHP